MKRIVSIKQTEDFTLPAFDNTKLVAFNTCPTWGVLRYGLHKAMGAAGRALALEAGSLSHEAFAALRMLDLYKHGLDYYSQSGGLDRVELSDRFIDAGNRLFPNGRWNELLSIFSNNDDLRRTAMASVIAVTEGSGYYDDPRDKRRTLSNIQESLFSYVDRLPWGKYIPYVNESFIGVEQAFDLTICIDDDILSNSEIEFRFIGRIDGVSLHIDSQTVQLEENKTASRLDDAWQQSFIMSHQVTGYCVAASFLLGIPVNEAVIYGMCIPLPRHGDYGGISRNPVSRHPDQFVEWTEWVYHTIRGWQTWQDDPINAPKYTHSCNRYFRPCSFIPYCASPKEDRAEIIKMMVDDEWSPLDKENVDVSGD